MNRSFSVKKVCTLGFLTAITVILAMFCTFRIGEFIKIPFKFISIFITSVIFGPLWGGTVAVIGDVLNVTVTGMAFNPLISAVEFLYGFIFGILFYNKPFSGKCFYFQAIICAVIMFLIDLFITSYILTLTGIFDSLKTAIYIRFISAVIKTLLQLAFILVSPKFQFQKLMEK